MDAHPYLIQLYYLSTIIAMADYVQKYFSPRLLDYIVIVGTRTPSASESVQVPELLRRYPPEDHKDFPLPPDVVFFCQPEGCINTNVRRLSQRDTNSFVFTLTEKDTSRVRYGICINFYRRLDMRTSMSSRSGDEESSQGGEKQSNRCLSLISLCIISHHPFFSTFRECLTILKRMILMLSERNRDKKHRRDFVWTLLTTRISPELAKMIPDNVIDDVREVETWCLKLLSAPVPIPGKTKVELEVLSVDLRPPLIFALPGPTRFSLVDFPLHLPLELLGVETCIKVLTMIMMEHKIVLQSRDYNALSMSVMAFVTMIYPLEYMFPVIPLLPTCMNSAEQLLLAPTPYIIGVPASFLLYKRQFKLPDDIWLVDLDTNKIIKPVGAEDLPPLPEPEGSTLKNHFKQVLASMSITLPHMQDNSANNSNIVPNFAEFNPLNYGNDVDSVDIATRIAMVKLYHSPGLLLNFNEYTRIIRLFPRPVVAFQVNSFLHSRPKVSLFLSKFVRTQAVEYFAEWSLSPSNVAFIRVQNGMYSPVQIGDKHKWYSKELDVINFKVWNISNCVLSKIYLDFINKDDDSDNESEDESDVSTSSSFSSLNEFVEEMCNANRLNTQFIASLKESSCVLTLCDRTIFCPPVSLQYANGKTSSGNDNVERAHHSSFSSLSSSSDDESDQSVHEFRPTSLYEGDEVKLPPMPSYPQFVKMNSLNSNLGKLSENTESDLENSRTATLKDSSSVESNHTLQSNQSSTQMNISPSNSMDKSSGTSTPTLSKTKSISSVFSRSQSQHRDSITNFPGQSLFDRLTTEAKDMAREAKAVAKEVVTKPSAQASKKKLLANFQAISEPVKGSAKEFWRSSKDEPDNAELTSSPSIMSSMSSDFNGLADKTAGMLSGFLNATKNSNLANKLREKAQPFGPFPKGKKGPIEKSNLIKHSSSQTVTSSADQKTQSQNDNQQFVRDMVGLVLESEKIGWLKMKHMKKLMEDEQYRLLTLQYITSRFQRKISPDDHIEDVQISKSVWKEILKLLNAMINGIEQNYSHHGSSSGMASTFLMLEIAHTYYWVVKGTSAEESLSVTTTCSQGSTPLGSNENLTKMNEILGTAKPAASAELVVLPPSEEDTSNQQTPNSALCSRQGSQAFVSVPPQVLSRKASIESEPPSDASPCNVSDAGSLTVNPVLANRLCGTSFRSTCSDSDIEGLQSRQTRTSSVWSSKSSVSAGFRYHGGSLFGSLPCDEQRSYLFQGIIGTNRSSLWDEMQFWEDAFLDAVSQEREVVGMDQGPSEMMERYRAMSEIDKKRLEHDEDRLLATFLFNMCAFMIMVNVNRTEIKRKCRRLLGKCHIGLAYSAEINEVLDQIDFLHGNDIDLKPLTTKQKNKHTYPVHIGTDASGEMLFMEVRAEGLILRSINGTVVERWWFERLVNMSFTPKSNVLCLWRLNRGQTQLHKYWSSRCKEVYYAIKTSMMKAAETMTGTLPGATLGGEFPIQDMKTGEGGLLQVSMEGVGLLFENSKFFIRLDCIRKCFAGKDGIFIIEQYNPKTRQITPRKYRSQMSDQICYAVLCVFSYIAAGQPRPSLKKGKLQKTLTKRARRKCSRDETLVVESGGPSEEATEAEQVSSSESSSPSQYSPTIAQANFAAT